MLDSPLFKPNHILNSCRPPHYQISRPATVYTPVATHRAKERARNLKE